MIGAFRFIADTLVGADRGGTACPFVAPITPMLPMAEPFGPPLAARVSVNTLTFGDLHGDDAGARRVLGGVARFCTDHGLPIERVINLGDVFNRGPNSAQAHRLALDVREVMLARGLAGDGRPRYIDLQSNHGELFGLLLRNVQDPMSLASIRVGVQDGRGYGDFARINPTPDAKCRAVIAATIGDIVRTPYRSLGSSVVFDAARGSALAPTLRSYGLGDIVDGIEQTLRRYVAPQAGPDDPVLVDRRHFAQWLAEDGNLQTAQGWHEQIRRRLLGDIADLGTEALQMPGPLPNRVGGAMTPEEIQSVFLGETHFEDGDVVFSHAHLDQTVPIDRQAPHQYLTGLRGPAGGTASSLHVGHLFVEGHDSQGVVRLQVGPQGAITHIVADTSLHEAGTAMHLFLDDGRVLRFQDGGEDGVIVTDLLAPGAAHVMAYGEGRHVTGGQIR